MVDAIRLVDGARRHGLQIDNRPTSCGEPKTPVPGGSTARLLYGDDSVDVLIKIYGTRIGSPTTTPRRANTWQQVGMNGRPFLACAMLIDGAS